MAYGDDEDYYGTFIKDQERYLIECGISGIYSDTDRQSEQFQSLLTEKTNRIKEIKKGIQKDLSEAFEGKAADEADEFLEKTTRKIDFPNPIREI